MLADYQHYLSWRKAKALYVHGDNVSENKLLIVV